MDVSHLAHLIRRSRSRSFAAGPAGHGNLDVRSPNGSANGIVLEKKAAGEYGHVTAPSGAATRTVGQAVQVTDTHRQAAQAATIGMTNKRPDLITATRVSTSEGSAKATLAAVSSAKSTIAQPSSAVPSTTSTSTSTSSSTSTSTSTSSSTSTTPSTTSTRTSTTTTSSATPTSTSTSSAVRALTTSSSSTRSALPSSTLDAAKASTSSSGMSTGAVVGIALGAIVGVVVIGSFIGRLYRKYTARSYSTKSPWAKIDDDITPYPPPNEKYSDSPADDIYGGAAAPVIGSRRALALARENAYDGSLRPDSEMYDRGSNHAGFGAGNMAMATSPTYGYDAQGRPYNPQAGATPMSYGYEDQYSPYYDQSPQSADHRQLVGPNAHPYAVAMPTAMPMGRPHAPSTAAEFALAEDFADEPLTPGLAYTADEPRTPVSQIGTAIAPPAGPNGTYNQNRSRVSLTPQAPRVMSPTESLTVHDTVPAPHLAPPPPVASANSLTPSHIPLPAFAPLSPLMDDFTFNKRQSQPLGMYEDERSAQKRMYGEVASTAGIVEPTTPYSAGPSPTPQLNESTTSTTSSFSAPQANTSTETMRLPELTLNPPEPYVHGQPLSPLKEVPTPLSTASTGEPLLNPFDLPLPTRHPVGSSNLTAPSTPYTASSAGATGYPSAVLSAAYPPPSPGGMSVPGSVTDSPTWVNETPKGRAVSVYEEDDAYGGI